MDVGNIYLIIAAGLLVFSVFKSKEKTKKALIVAGKSALTVVPVLVVVFLLMGLISAFLSKELIGQVLGDKSGLPGILISEVLGSIALIVPAAVFPFTGMLHEKGASYPIIFAFIMTAILIGISTIPAEINFFGARFTIVRNVLTFVFIFALSILFGMLIA